METKLRIIDLLEKHAEGMHMRGLSRQLGTGLMNVSRHIAVLQKEGVIKRQKVANTVNLTLREGQRTIAYLKQANSERFLALPKNVQAAAMDFLGELESKPLIALIFGSYARNNFTKDSDIDILLVFQKIEDRESIENTAKRISLRANTRISPVYTDFKSFEKNFLDREHDFSREIRHASIILSGTELYYPLVWRLNR
ncbi:MAG: nucleotidyltransferase domain-containing protein [Nanoarchaeota archaeon]|nr:nucleotidyltransferase domain-containing protein [Nanoarchaeota archaeon]